MPLLNRISGPRALRELPADRLPQLCAEIREFLIDRVCRAGGHLGPNLGVVELTVALHRVFDSPADRIVFDTGHQAYVHKMLTGRQGGFTRLRAAGGPAGYPRRSESPHDHVENSHASTALSYLDGLTRIPGPHRAIAVIGDGALTGGMCGEALNNLGRGAGDGIVVLNDNGRSYDPTVGALAVHLAALRAGRHRGPTLFENLGLAYLGPVDGHDVAAVEKALRTAAALHRAVVVHCVTEKGRGWLPAETDEADRMHGIGVLDPGTGRAAPATARSWTAVFGDALADLGADHPEVVAMTAAMMRPVGMHPFAERYPDRVVDVGIAEQHAVTTAAGLAMTGRHPILCLYATFLNRAYDQLLMDVALHRLPVTVVLDRAGVTGPDGPSHHGMWDLALLGTVPGLRVAAPRDSTQLTALLREAVGVHDGPTALRFPKASAGADLPAISRMNGLDLLHRSRSRPLDVLIVAAGVMAGPAVRAAEILAGHGVGVTVADPRWLLPINPALVYLAARHDLVVTVEDGIRAGGFGAALAQAATDARIRARVHNLGLPRDFIDHGSRADILATHGLTADRIATTVRTLHAAPQGAGR